jgi:hypothetical protein
MDLLLGSQRHEAREIVGNVTRITHLVSAHERPMVGTQATSLALIQTGEGS